MSWTGLVRIAVIRALHLELGCGVREAVALSDSLLRSGSGSVALGRVSVAFDREALERDLRQGLGDALESAPRPRRGRPARRRSGVASAEPAG